MLAADLIHPIVPSLTISEPVGLALKKMEECELTTLPVVEGGIFLGFVEDEILLEQEHLDVQIAQVELECSACWVLQTSICMMYYEFQMSNKPNGSQ